MEEVRKTSACEQQNSSQCRLVEKLALNGFSAVLPIHAPVSIFLERDCFLGKPIRENWVQKQGIYVVTGVQRQLEDRFYSQMFQSHPALVNNRKLWSKLNSDGYILTLTFSLTKTVNGVLQPLLAVNRLLDITDHWALFLSVSGSLELERSLCPLPECHG